MMQAASQFRKLSHSLHFKLDFNQFGPKCFSGRDKGRGYIKKSVLITKWNYDERFHFEIQNTKYMSVKLLRRKTHNYWAFVKFLFGGLKEKKEIIIYSVCFLKEKNPINV